MCYSQCPEIFQPDLEGYSSLAMIDIPDELEGKVRDAAEACPEHAITVTY